MIKISATLIIAVIGIVGALAALFGPKLVGGLKDALNPLKALSKGGESIKKALSKPFDKIKDKIEQGKEKSAKRKAERKVKADARREKLRQNTANAMQKVKTIFKPKSGSTKLNIAAPLVAKLQASPAVRSIAKIPMAQIRALPKKIPAISTIKTARTDGHKFRFTVKPAISSRAKPIQATKPIALFKKKATVFGRRR